MINVHMSSCKAPVMLVIFQYNLNILHRFSKKNLQISNLKKIRLLGKELAYADRQ